LAPGQQQVAEFQTTPVTRDCFGSTKGVMMMKLFLLLTVAAVISEARVEHTGHATGSAHYHNEHDAAARQFAPSASLVDCKPSRSTPGTNTAFVEVLDTKPGHRVYAAWSLNAGSAPWGLNFCEGLVDSGLDSVANGRFYKRSEVSGPYQAAPLTVRINVGANECSDVSFSILSAPFRESQCGIATIIASTPTPTPTPTPIPPPCNSIGFATTEWTLNLDATSTHCTLTKEVGTGEGGDIQSIKTAMKDDGGTTDAKIAVFNAAQDTVLFSNTFNWASSDGGTLYTHVLLAEAMTANDGDWIVVQTTCDIAQSTNSANQSRWTFFMGEFDGSTFPTNAGFSNLAIEVCIKCP